MTDLLQTLLSQLGPAALVLVLALLGLKRLAHYDEELRHIRDKVDERSKTLHDEVRVDFQSMRADISIVAERELAKIVSSQEDEQRRRVEQWRAEVDAITDKLARYDFLRGYIQPELAAQLYINRMGSLDKVHDVVADLFNRAGRVEAMFNGETAAAQAASFQREAFDLIRFAIDSKIPGDHDDYHNMAVELARQNYPKLALEILEEGMRRFPGSPDLVGSAMQYAVGNGEMDKASDYFDRLLMLDNSVWNWRAFTFAVKYQIAKGDADASQALYEASCEHLPKDERPAVQYAELFERRGQLAQAVDVLEETIARVPTAPQAALKLSELYKDQGRYAEAMTMGRRALAMDALDQSRINNAAAHLTIGLAGERLWLESADGSAGDRIAPRIFLTHYAAALGAPDCPHFAKRAVETRKATVRGQLLVEGVSNAEIDALFGEIGLETERGGKTSAELTKLLNMLHEAKEASA